MEDTLFQGRVYRARILEKVCPTRYKHPPKESGSARQGLDVPTFATLTYQYLLSLFLNH